MRMLALNCGCIINSDTREFYAKYRECVDGRFDECYCDNCIMKTHDNTAKEMQLEYFCVSDYCEKCAEEIDNLMIELKLIPVKPQRIYTPGMCKNCNRTESRLVC